MSALKQRLLTNWHAMRIFRMGIGIMILGAGIHDKDWTMGLLSIFFLYQGITDTGCCSSGSCYTGRRSTRQRDGDKAEHFNEYEEIK